MSFWQRNPPTDGGAEEADLDIAGLSYAPTVELSWPSSLSPVRKPWHSSASFRAIIDVRIADPQEDFDIDTNDEILEAIEKQWGLKNASWTDGTWIRNYIGRNEEAWTRYGTADIPLGKQRMLRDEIGAGEVLENPGSHYDIQQDERELQRVYRYYPCPMPKGSCARYPELKESSYCQGCSAKLRLDRSLASQNPRSKRDIDKLMSDLESERHTLFFKLRDTTCVQPEGSIWFRPEDIATCTKAHKKLPRVIEIDAELKALRAERKEALAAEKAAKALPKPRGPAKGPEIRRGRCHKCGTKYKWADRPGVRIVASGPGVSEWGGIECPKCHEPLFRSSTAGADVKWSDFVDLDAGGEA